MLSKNYPMIAGSPDGICENLCIVENVEIKCPMSAKTFKNYVSNKKPTQNCTAPNVPNRTENWLLLCS